MKKFLGALTAVFCLCLTLCVARGEATAVLPDENELAEKTNAILNYLNLSDKDDYDVIFGIYNYICQTVEYDWPATEKTDWDGVSIGYGQTAYEAICQEKAVCAGIANAVTLLLERSGVPCRTVVGYAPSGIGHAWNLVQLDSQWYFMDATNDLAAQTYDYFLKSWTDLGNYQIFSDDAFDISDYTLTDTSYPDANAQLDSYGGFLFNVGLGDISIISYTGTEANLVIPAQINGRSVKRLTQYCIYENSNIETLVVSEGVERISSLFAGACPNLKSITLPASAQLLSNSSSSIVSGLDGFVDSCNAMETVIVAEGNPWLCVIDNVLYNREMTDIIYCPPQNRITSIHIPEGIQEIRSDTFSSNIYLQDVTLPNSVTTIGYWAFSQCSALEKVNIPANCNFIGQYAFHGTQVAEVHLAANTMCVFPAFSSVLETLTADENSPYYYASDNVLFTRDGKLVAYAGRKPDTTYTVPSHVTTIGMHAFQHAGSLERIILSEGLVTIEGGAFYGCESLREITIPPTVTRLEDRTFFDCFNLSRITIPSSVEVINGNHVFANVTGFIIRGEAGSAAQTWAEEHGIAFHDIATEWNVSGTCGDSIVWTLSENGTLQFTGTGSIPEYSVMPWELYLNTIEALVISKGISSLPPHFLRVCRNLTSVSLPEDLTSIGDYAFAGCHSLTHIDLPDNITTIGYYTFADCKALRTAELPARLEYIHSCAFQNCSALSTIEIPEGTQQIDIKAFSSCTALTTLILRPRGTLWIDPEAFNSCSPAVYCFPDTEAEAWARENGFSVVSISLINGILPDDYLETMQVLTLPADLTVIEAEAFMNLPVQVVIVPAGCTAVGSRAFAGCADLVYISLPDGADVAEDTFEGCTNVYVDTGK